ncbi:MAG: hypothetical protein V4519_02450 [Patescibacteria group bacterium]
MIKMSIPLAVGIVLFGACVAGINHLKDLGWPLPAHWFGPRGESTMGPTTKPTAQTQPSTRRAAKPAQPTIVKLTPPKLISLNGILTGQSGQQPAKVATPTTAPATPELPPRNADRPKNKLYVDPMMTARESYAEVENTFSFSVTLKGLQDGKPIELAPGKRIKIFPKVLSNPEMGTFTAVKNSGRKVQAFSYIVNFKTHAADIAK